jgi:hypothetical protein
LDQVRGFSVDIDQYLIMTAPYLGLALWVYVLGSLLLGSGMGVPPHGSRVLWIVLIMLLPMVGMLVYRPGSSPDVSA